MAGKITIMQEGGLAEKLIDIKEPICYIPNLCIHLQTLEERKAFNPCKEKNVLPLLIEKDLNGVQLDEDVPYIFKVIQKFYPEYQYDMIVDVDLSLYDADAVPKLVGTKKEYVLSGRLDNQCSVFATMEALAHCESSDMDYLCCIAFDHENRVQIVHRG